MHKIYILERYTIIHPKLVKFFVNKYTKWLMPYIFLIAEVAFYIDAFCVWYLYTNIYYLKTLKTKTQIITDDTYTAAFWSSVVMLILTLAIGVCLVYQLWYFDRYEYYWYDEVRKPQFFAFLAKCKNFYNTAPIRLKTFVIERLSIYKECIRCLANFFYKLIFTDTGTIEFLIKILSFATLSIIFFWISVLLFIVGNELWFIIVLLIFTIFLLITILLFYHVQKQELDKNSCYVYNTFNAILQYIKFLHSLLEKQDIMSYLILMLISFVFILGITTLFLWFIQGIISIADILSTSTSTENNIAKLPQEVNKVQPITASDAIAEKSKIEQSPEKKEETGLTEQQQIAALLFTVCILITKILF
jgi:hypothetical protein